MTREDAILWMRVLKQSEVNWVGEQDEDEDIIARCEEAEQEAFDMAIEALQKDIERHERVIRASERHLGIVRCKDCRYCTEYYDKDGYPYWECDEWDSGTGADGFCHYGERREP